MIAAVTMVKDEADIIHETITHLLAEGIDKVFVLDNMSDDETPKILDELAHDHPHQVHWFEDRDPAYYQARKINGLALIAAGYGADWILPFDADEFWYAPHTTLKSAIELSGADVIYARAWTQVTNKLRHPDPKPLPKVCYRWNVSARVHQGAHGVDWPNPRKAAGLEIREFQYRSFEHLCRKARNGKAAYDATTLPESEGAHWRQLGALDDFDLFGEYCNYIAAGTVTDPLPWSA